MVQKSVLSFSLLLLSLSLYFTSCNKYDSDIAEIKDDIEQIKAELSLLESAYAEGKIISSVVQITDAPADSWLITFSDNTSISLYSGSDGEDGLDGVTPYIKIDENNFWAVSYDGGITYSLILDNNGNPISATGSDGEDGKDGVNDEDGNDGENGQDGADGKDGANGICVRVVVNNEGYYVFETYNPDTNEVIETITTKYSSNPKGVIRSIVEDPATGVITLTMEDGTVYTFGQVVIHPQSIVVLTESALLSHGGSAQIEFRVNPSNARINLSEISLDLVKAGTKADVSYVNKPDDYTITSITNSKDKDGNNKRGQYIAVLKDKETNPDYSDKVAIVISTKDSKNNAMEISSDIFDVISVYPSKLPRVYVITPGSAAINSKTEWLKNSNIRIVDENGNEDLNVSTSIRGRGNSTWTYPKKPYAIKLDSKAEVLGMPKHKRWVLLANWMDRTLLRNDIAFEMGRRVMSWAPRGKFVELYLNGKHLGSYYLCEHIKVDESRVDIAELDEDTDFTDASEKTGGYILEFDTYGPNDEPNYFYTSIKNYPVSIKEPDEEVITSSSHEGFVYIKGYMDSIEELFESDKKDLAKYEDIKNLIDINSYIDWWLIHELAGNGEPGHPKSSYMYKARDGKLYAGPVWDFDWGTFCPGMSSFIISSSLWYGYLFNYTEFKADVKSRWNELKSTFEGIEAYIQTQADYIKESNAVNISKWPISISVNGDERMTYDQSIERMLSAYTVRLEVIDNLVSNL